jgi:proteasome alpha subunit
MGYDRASTMFSPDGRLLQVEYAKKTVSQGTTAIGIVCKDGVVVIADKRVTESLVVPSSVEKVFQIDDHIGSAAAGILSDGRMLIERARLIAQQNKVTYGTPIETITLVKEICDIKQSFTQFGGARPFGVSLLFIGADDGKSSLFVTDPTGIFVEYKATAIGEAENEIKAMLTSQYNDEITVKEGIRMGINMLKKVLGKGFDIKRVDAAYIMGDEKKFVRMEGEDIKKFTK